MAASRLNTSDSYARALLNLGRCARQQDRDQEARQYYDAFLKIWNHADPDRPELREATADRNP